MMVSIRGIYFQAFGLFDMTTLFEEREHLESLVMVISTQSVANAELRKCGDAAALKPAR